MPLRIFDTDPDAKPAPKANFTPRDEIAFSLRAGMMKGKKPVSLDAWRITTGDPAKAEALVQLLGGVSEEYDPSKEENLHVLTETDSIEVILAGNSAIEDKMILWGPRGPIHECDGETFLSPPEEAGTPCGCPRLLAERKAKSKSGTGPSPHIAVTFRLAHDPELGIGKWVSTGWSLPMVLHEVRDALSQVSGEALCRLRLELVEYHSDKYGQVRYRKPVIEVLGSYNDAIAETRD